MNERQDETVESVMEECIEKLEKHPEVIKAKPKMISLKDQLANDRVRQMNKIMRRRIKAGVKQPTSMVRPGNKDFGCPYSGKDKFSGQGRKFEDRIERGFRTENDEKVVIHRLWYADNNKYNGDGTLKDQVSLGW